MSQQIIVFLVQQRWSEYLQLENPHDIAASSRSEEAQARRERGSPRGRGRRMFVGSRRSLPSDGHPGDLAFPLQRWNGRGSSMRARASLSSSRSGSDTDSGPCTIQPRVGSCCITPEQENLNRFLTSRMRAEFGATSFHPPTTATIMRQGQRFRASSNSGMGMGARRTEDRSRSWRRRFHDYNSRAPEREVVSNAPTADLKLVQLQQDEEESFDVLQPVQRPANAPGRDLPENPSCRRVLSAPPEDAPMAHGAHRPSGLKLADAPFTAASPSTSKKNKLATAARRSPLRVVPPARMVLATFLAVPSWTAPTLFPGLGFVQAASSVAIVANADMGPCVCDVTKNECDPHCCCDADCTTAMKTSFDCLPEGPGNTLASQYSCFSKSYVQEVNPRTDLSVLQDDLRNLLCVHVDNSANDGRYFDSSAATTHAQYSSAVSSRSLSAYPTLSTPTEHLDTSTASSGYVVGHLVKVQQTWDANQVLQPLSAGALQSGGALVQKTREFKVPLPDASGRCSDQPVPFLFDIPTTTCTHQSLDLSTECTGSKLNAQSMVTMGFQTQNLYASSADDATSVCSATTCAYAVANIETCGTTFTKPTLSGTTVSSVASTACTLTATEQQVGKLASHAASTCSDAVIGAHYTIEYAAATTATKNTITGVKVNFQYADITSAAATDVVFSTSVTFVPDSATVTTSTIVSKSGNPGYRFGSPLLLEKCGASGSTQACTSFTDATGAGAGARHDLPGISSLGECVYGSSSAVTSYLATDGVGVNFGEDTVLGCSLSFTAAELATFCAAGTTSILNLFAVVPATGSGSSQKVYKFGFSHVAAWGSSDATNMDDYVSIEDLGDQVAANTGNCDRITTTSYQFAYAPFGEINNPQYKITGAWGKNYYTNLVHTLADPSKKQSFPFFVNVQFVKQSDNSDLDVNVPPRPDLPVYLPADVFYPLTLFDNAAVPTAGGGHLLLVFALLLGYYGILHGGSFSGGVSNKGLGRN